MLKRIMIALAGLLAMLALAVAPASGAQTTLDMYPQFNLGGVPEPVSTVPEDCEPTPLEVLSAENKTATDADFFSNSTCTGEPLATVPADGGVVNEIFDEVQETGAIAYQAG